MSGEEHTGSYYAATRNDKVVYPQLEGERQAEVCVIGGGFTGVSCALTLAERGHSVILLEQNRIGWGASGRNGGQLIGGLSGSKALSKTLGPRKVWSLAYRGNDIVKERIKKYSIECDLKFGYIEAAFKQRQLDAVAEDYAEHQAQGLGDQLEMVGRDQIGAILGTKAYIGGLINNLNGHLHPLNLCLGEARAAAELGAGIFEQSQVVAIVHGDKATVRTREGSVTADKVLLAGNAYHWLEQRSLSGLLFPAGSYIIATEPLSDQQVARINPRDLAVCDLNHVLDYYRLSADKRLLYGGRCNYSGRDPRNITKSILPRMLDIYPQLEGVAIDYEWGGNIGIIIRRIPALGRIGRNVYYAMGYSGHGVSQSHTLGEAMADAMEGNAEILAAYERIRHWRIPGSRWFGNQIVALGMLYYRARDLL